MGRVLQDLTYDSLAFVVEKNAVEEFRLWSRWPGLQLHVNSDRIWTVTDIPSPIFNNVFRATFPPGKEDESIGQALAPYRERKVPAYWWVGRSSRPANLGGHLEARGLRTAFIAAAMAIDLQALPDDLSAPAGFLVEEVLNIRSFEQWLKFTASTMDLPLSAVGPWVDMHRYLGIGGAMPLRHFLALMGGEPVAAASLFTGAGVAGLANLITRGDCRKRGIGTALALSVLKAGRAAGFRAGALLAEPAMSGMYRRMGFREYGREWCYLLNGRNEE